MLVNGKPHTNAQSVNQASLILLLPTPSDRFHKKLSCSLTVLRTSPIRAGPFSFHGGDGASPSIITEKAK